jgi:hypothetical protein
MAEGWIAATGNAALDTLLGTYRWLKLHTGAPGAAGTANAATNTTRKQATFASASGGAATTSGAVTWTSVPAAEDYTHVSGWSAETNGAVGWTGTITANAVAVSDDFTLPAGDVDVSVPVAS